MGPYTEDKRVRVRESEREREKVRRKKANVGSNYGTLLATCSHTTIERE